MRVLTLSKSLNQAKQAEVTGSIIPVTSLCYSSSDNYFGVSSPRLLPGWRVLIEQNRRNTLAVFRDFAIEERAKMAARWDEIIQNNYLKSYRYQESVWRHTPIAILLGNKPEVN